MCYRAFSRFLAPRQELGEFLAQTKGLSRINRRQEDIPPLVAPRDYPNLFEYVNPLEQRKAYQELADFDTSSSDDDAKYFSLRRWISDAIMLERLSGTRFLLHMVACIIAFYASMYISSPLLNQVRALSFLGHWRLEETAYCDMELARFKQRISFARLVAYD